MTADGTVGAPSCFVQECSWSACNVPLDAGLQKRANFSILNVGWKGPGIKPDTHGQHADVLGAVYTCPNLRINRRARFVRKQNRKPIIFMLANAKIYLLDTLGSKSYTESYGDSYEKLHV
jgi:hypothetical protein